MWIQRLLFALLVIAVLQGLFFSRFNLRALSYKRRFEPATATEGDTVTMVEVIRNAKILPIPWLRIEAEISRNLVFGASAPPDGPAQRQFHRSIFSLPPYTTITRTHRVHCLRRGYYHIRSVAVTTGDVLGTGSQKSVDIPTDTAVTVYPSLVPIEDIFNNQISFTGDVVVRRWIIDDPFRIRGVREYAPGDPQNRINWKATARTGVMQVHDYDFTADMRLMLIVNVDTHENQWSTTTDEACAERGIQVAASLAQYAVSNGIEVGVTSNGRRSDETDSLIRLEPQTGQEYLHEIFEALARLTLSRRYSFHTLLEQERLLALEGRDILILSAYVDELIEEQIEALRRAGHHVEVLHIPHSVPAQKTEAAS